MEYLDSRETSSSALLSSSSCGPDTWPCASRWRAHSGRGAPLLKSGRRKTEALCSSSHAYEHPSDTFPEFVETSPVDRSEDIRTTRVPEDSAVRNSVRIGGDARDLGQRIHRSRQGSTMPAHPWADQYRAGAGRQMWSRAASLTPSPLKVGEYDSRFGTHSRADSRFTRRFAPSPDSRLTAARCTVTVLIDEVSAHGTQSHESPIGARSAGDVSGDRGRSGDIPRTIWS